ncbi:MAG: prenyltransferase/squalene oxidase repeat-containing protein [Pseudomonadota bacterium]
MIPQALGDALSGEGYRSPDDLARKRARGLFQNLLSSRSPLSQNTAWGLPFAWGGTKATPPHWPTTITTSTVLSGILDAWHLLDEKDVLPEVESAIRFVFDDCGILETDQGPCILYGPGDTRPILNASAFAAGVFARVGEFLGRDDLMNFAQDALLTIVRYQNDDGSWYYAPPHGEHALDDIIDNRHTGYVLEGLAEGNNLLKNEEIASSIERGWRYLEENLIDDGKPRWSPEQTWPIDSSDVSQSILTAVSVNKMEFAGEFANFALDKFYMGDGRFRYKVFEDGRSNDSVFIRWTQAPMYKALSKFRAKV